MTFDGDKYKTASDKAISFIKRQLDVNNFKFSVSFDQAYSDSYSGDVISGTVNGLNPDEDQVFPKYINVDTYYDYSYKGKVHEQLTDSKCESDSGRLEDQSEITIHPVSRLRVFLFGIPAGFFLFSSAQIARSSPVGNWRWISYDRQ